MSGNLNFDDYVYWNKFFLNIIGFWPLPNETPIWRVNLQNFYTFIVIGSFISLGLMPMIVDMYMIFGDLEAFIQNLVVSLHTTIISLKISYLMTKKNVFKGIINEMQINWKNTLSPVVPEDKQNILLDYAKFSRSLTGVYLYAIYFLEISLFVLPFFYGINSDPIRTRRYPCCAFYFFDDGSNIAYGLVYFIQVLLIIGVGVSYIVGMDSFFSVAVCHFCAQLSILQKELMELGNDSKNVKGKVKLLIQKHNDQIRSSHQLDLIFGRLSLYQLMLSCTCICVTGFQLIIAISNEQIDFNGLVFFIIYLSGNFFQILLFCWPGNELMVQSMEVGNAAYQSLWTNLPNSSAQSILLLILMAQRPMYITAGGIFVMSLENFTQIVKASMSLLSGLRAFYANTNHY